MLSADLQTMKSDVATKFDAAILSALHRESNPPGIEADNICQYIDDLMEALDQTRQDLSEIKTQIPCDA